MEPLVLEMSEEFKMLEMTVEDTTSGMCIFQAETAREQQMIAYRLKDRIRKKAVVIDMADYSENKDAPAEIGRYKKILSQSPGCEAVIVCNIQLCGLWMGDISYIEKLNYMRDQMMECEKMWVFGMTPYFSILLSQHARDLYSYMMYNCSFASGESESSSFDEGQQEYFGDIRLLVNQFQEYRHYLEEQKKEEKMDWGLVNQTLYVWNQSADYLDFSAKQWMYEILELADSHFEKEEIGMRHMRAYQNMEFTYTRLGIYDKALKWSDVRMRLAKDFFDKNAVERARIYENRGYIYIKQEKWDEAEQYCNKAMKIYRMKETRSGAGVLSAWSKIALLSLEKEDFDSAMEIYKKCIDAIEEEEGECSTKLVTAYNNLGRAYEESGRISEALAGYKKAGELGEKYFSGNVQMKMCNLNNLSNIYHRLGDIDGAKKALLQAKKLGIAAYGKENEMMAHIYHNLAAVYAEYPCYGPAVKNYLQSIEIRKKVLGEKDTELIKSYMNLAGIYMHLRKTVEAFIYGKKALAICLDKYGLYHCTTAKAYSALAIICYTSGDLDDAESCLLEEKKIWNRLYGKNSREVKDCEYNLSRVWKDRQKATD